MIWIIFRFLIAIVGGFLVYKIVFFLLSKVSIYVFKIKLPYIKSALLENLSKTIENYKIVLSFTFSFLVASYIVYPNVLILNVSLCFLLLVFNRFLLIFVNYGKDLLIEIIENKELPKEDKSLYLTLTPIAKDIVKYFVNGILVLICLGIWGIDLRPFFGATAIVGAILGYAGRTTIEDVFGFLMLLVERPYYVGSEVEFFHESGYFTERGIVKEIALRNTIVNVADYLIYIPNREIKMFRVHSK